MKKLSKLFDNDRLCLEMLEKLGFKRENNRLILQHHVLNSWTMTENNDISDHDQNIYDTEENNNTYNDNNDNYNINQMNHSSNGDKNNMKSNSDSGDDVDVVTKSKKVEKNAQVVAIEFKKWLDEAIKSKNAFQLDQWIKKQQIQVMLYIFRLPTDNPNEDIVIRVPCAVCFPIATYYYIVCTYYAHPDIFLGLFFGWIFG